METQYADTMDTQTIDTQSPRTMDLQIIDTPSPQTTDTQSSQTIGNQSAQTMDPQSMNTHCPTCGSQVQQDDEDEGTHDTNLNHHPSSCYHRYYHHLTWQDAALFAVLPIVIMSYNDSIAFPQPVPSRVLLC